ncbi:MAG TPA: hypothetical protein VNS88_14485, partial [Nitrospiraceae bacterium]|nr:hypothetical protein [Nitrospiraceae bacterium]
NPPNCSVYNAGNYFDVGPAMAVNNICMFAVNWPVGVIFFGRNGTWYNGANPGNGTGTGAITGIPSGTVSPYVQIDALAIGQKVTGNFTAADLVYPAPSGFLAWSDG